MTRSRLPTSKSRFTTGPSAFLRTGGRGRLRSAVLCCALLRFHVRGAHRWRRCRVVVKFNVASTVLDVYQHLMQYVGARAALRRCA